MLQPLDMFRGPDLTCVRATSSDASPCGFPPARAVPRKRWPVTPPDVSSTRSAPLWLLLHGTKEKEWS